MNCKLLSMDTSTTETGFAIFHDAILKNSGVVQSTEESGPLGKLKSMGEGLLALLDKEKPDIVVLEKMNVGRNVKTARLLSELTGIVIGWTLRYPKVYYEELSPSEWRSALGMQGKFSREEMKRRSIQYVIENTGHEPVSDNEADAICIGLGYIKRFERMIF